MEPIARPLSLTETVLAQLRQAIVRGDLALGATLSERVLALQLGVSKTPVREALAQLRLEGLVRIYPQRGAAVFTLSAREVKEICEFRQTLETAALRLSLERDPKGLSADLDAAVAAMVEARRRTDTKAYLDADTEFHLAFFRRCGNTYLSETYGLHVGKIAALRTHLAGKPLHTQRSFEEHCEIAAMVGSGDTASLMAVLDRHIERTRLTYAESVDDIAQADAAASSRPGGVLSA